MSRETATGGREATQAIIPGRVALSVGRSSMSEPQGFFWRALADIADLQSGHTPSRSKPTYWDGDIPWIGIRDATKNHGTVIDRTGECVTQAGIDNSSARILPKDTVCLSRTASVGYVIQMGRPMATSQDFVNWVCGPELNPNYLRYILMLEQESVRRFSHGTTHQTMYYPEAKALHVLVPDRGMQDTIAEVLGALDDKIAANESIIHRAQKLAVAYGSSSQALVSVAEIVEHKAISIRPEAFDSTVAHYSLPAFDSDCLPAIDAASDIKSNKFLLERPCVLVSKLNPRIPRIWNVPILGDRQSVASTEFVVLEPRDGQSSVLWSILSQPEVLAGIAGRVSGTSGSHQRVRPAEILAASVGDPATLSESARGVIISLGDYVHAVRHESVQLANTRDELLPLLMSGKLRVKDAEQIVEKIA